MRRILYVLVFLLAFTSIAFSESNLTNNYIELKKGDFGDDVSALQKKLTELEYLIGDEPGHFGTGTKNALFMYQNDHNLIPTGILDEETYELLFPTQYRTTENVGSNFHEDAYPGEIITAKSFLWLLGYDVDKTDEVVDDDFSRIIQEFQKDHGINVTGVYNHETSEAMRSELSKIVFYPFLSRNSQNELRLGIMNRAGEQIIPANYTDYNVSNGIIKLWEVIRNRDGSGSIYGHSYYYITGEEIKIRDLFCSKATFDLFIGNRTENNGSVLKPRLAPLQYIDNNVGIK